ncbi:hypothetical protein AMJ39_00940 [candidate division TA06 bacterium DG_24]|uniref:SGNH hydrolase-type esterase domain-containing protein n=2 Tax=Bacteria division TA06 TaxID=1156500 RepID=A0A0S8GF75_UNCT6|nr:MAG: hypothetical protein AMJ39_00940 [candidate division TA06 bacterium DG_24]KPK71671.1 MAG: hypothetical protein AMJ82_00225 [candidate division TA06 bacterium SM23_40]
MNEQGVVAFAKERLESADPMGRGGRVRAERASRFSALSGNLVVLIFTCAFGLTFVEVGLRVWMGIRSQTEPPLWETLMRPSPSLGVEHNPDVNVSISFPEHEQKRVCFRTNNQGLRQDGDSYYEKPEGCLRLLVLGDSHMDGVVNNEELFAARLEEFFRSNIEHGTRPRVQVLNAAVATYGPLQQLLWLRQYGILYRPDIVIVVFYVGNDIVNLLSETVPHLEEAAGNEFVLADYPIQPSLPPTGNDRGMVLAAKFFLERHLVSYRLMRDWVKRSPLGPVLATLGLADPEKATVNARQAAEAISPEGMGQSLTQAHLARTRPDEIAAAFRKCDRVLDWLGDEVGTVGAECLLVLLPTKQQVEPDDDQERTARVAHILSLERPDLRFDDVVSSQIRPMAERAGISVIDPLPEFRDHRATSGGRLYYKTDWHLNSAGHRLLGEIVGRYLVEFDLLAARRS